MKLPVTINIALAGDHALNLHALASLLGQQESFRIISISKDVNQLGNSLTLGGREKYPQIVLLDINFDLFRAACIISFLKTSHPDIRVVALGLTKDRDAVLRILQMGADSYLPKNSKPEELENTLRRLAGTGEDTTPQPFDASAAAHPAPVTAHPAAAAAHPAFAPHPAAVVITAWPPVTPTERRYFRLAMSEASHQDIRRSLKLCESTFTSLITALYRRFDVSSRDGLVLALYRRRFILMDDI